MSDVFNKLFETGIISEEVKDQITGAWESKVKEHRDSVTAELREEFANRYEHDKTNMIEAIDAMVSERLESEIKELSEDKKALAEARVEYKKKVAEHSGKLQEFVLGQLSKEISELNEDRKKVSENFAKLEDFVVKQLAKEITEFAEDKKDLAETKVKLVREAKSKLDEVKRRFIEKSAKVVESAVNSKLTDEIKQLKEDISASRENHFGRKLFEAFANEYMGSFLNEKSETAKLMKVVAEKEDQLAEAKKAITEKDTIVESKEAEIAKARDEAERVKVMNELLNPLGKDKREIMSELLESVQTSKLHTAFEKYLPAVMEDKRPSTATKKAIMEGTEVTGDKEIKVEENSNLIELRRLAGLN
jgi:DNA repair exonuclease SbcCD ATPase subunit